MKPNIHWAKQWKKPASMWFMAVVGLEDPLQDAAHRPARRR